MVTSSNYNVALEAARKWHSGQTRKYTGTPYVDHPIRVAQRVWAMQPPNAHVLACAAVLHDVIEDCTVTPQQIESLFSDPIFGSKVAEMVQELTNPSKQFPRLSRKERKQMDREHLSKCSNGARLIKLLDRIDNLQEMSGASLDFRLKYSQESILLAQALAGTNSLLEERLVQEAENLAKTIPA